MSLKVSVSWFSLPREDKYALLMATFVLALGVANIIASKVIILFGFAAPAGIIVYPLTFMVTDVVSEVYGKQKAKRIVWTGFAMMVLLLVITRIAVWLPPAPFYREQEAFRKIFDASSRIILASLIAYLASQSCDVALFHFWKGVTKDRHLWIRNNLSTMTSQLIDTILFIFIAFYGIYNFYDCFRLIGGQYLFKFVFAVLDTPFVYMGVWWAKR
jgi:uncharacterized integral membrane protein (TIGR00697 family)